MIITIARECGCSGDVIGAELSAEYQIPVYDRKSICELAKQQGRYEKHPDFYEEKQADSFLAAIAEEEQEDWIRQIPENELKKLLGEQSCIVIGRCGNFAFRDSADMISIFLSGKKEHRLQKLMEEHGFSRRKAEQILEETDSRRKEYHRYYTGQDWGYAGNYHLCLDESRLGTEGVITILKEYIGLLKKSGTLQI